MTSISAVQAGGAVRAARLLGRAARATAVRGPERFAAELARGRG